MKTTHFSPLVATAARALAHLLAAALLLSFTPAASAQIVDIATDVTDANNLADTEPSIAVNPTNPLEILVVTFSEGWGPNTPAPVWRSTNGGTTWTKVFQLPQPPTNAGGPGDQKIAFSAAGNRHIAELDFAFNDFIYRQTAGPLANLTPGASYGSDQPLIEVDRFAAGPCFNRLYSPFLNTGASPNRSNVANSTNFGAAMTTVLAGSAAFNNRTTRIAVGPNGRVYIIYKTREGAVDSNFENAHFRVERSDNCGATWGALGATGVSVHGAATVQTWFTQSNASGLIIGFGNPAKGKVARARSSDAWIAVNPTNGDVYAAYVRKDASGRGQIYVARSTNQGVSWVSTRVTNGLFNSAYPEIAVTNNGAVGVLFIDYDDSGQATIFRHRFARSFDNGSTWPFQQVLQSMNPGPIANAQSGFLWGDYEGLTAQGNTFFGVFTGQSIGRAVVQLDPIFFTRSGVQPACFAALNAQLEELKAEITGLQKELQTASPGEKPGIIAQIKAAKIQQTAANNALKQCVTT